MTMRIGSKVQPRSRNDLEEEDWIIRSMVDVVEDSSGSQSQKEKEREKKRKDGFERVFDADDKKLSVMGYSLLQQYACSLSSLQIPIIFIPCLLFPSMSECSWA